ncbi:hypothetical protein SALBM311S_09408 [Streptomyces alboniger]
MTLTSPFCSLDRKVADARPLPRRTSTVDLPSAPVVSVTVSPVMRVTVCVLVVPGLLVRLVIGHAGSAQEGVIAPVSRPAAAATAERAWSLRMCGLLPLNAER